MGRGNWFAGHHDTPQSLVYVDLTREDDGPDGLEAEDRWEFFKENLLDALGPTWAKVERDDSTERMWREEYGSRNDVVLFANGHMCVVIDAEGDNWHLGVALCPLPYAGQYYADLRQRAGLAMHNFDRLKLRFPDIVANLGYPVRLRTSAWTSTAYKPVLKGLATCPA